MPPSAKISLPVMDLLSSDARKSATSAISSGSAIRLSGVCSIIFALLLMLNPLAAAVGLLWLIAVWAFVFGILLIALSFKLLRHSGALHQSQKPSFAT